MDTLNLTGIWLNFPGINTLGKQRAAAGMYLAYLQRELQQWKKEKKKTARELRHSLLREVEKRIIQRDEDDLAILLMS